MKSRTLNMRPLTQAVLLASTVLVSGQALAMEETTFKYGGFIKLDAIWAKGDDGGISNPFLLVPGAIATGGQSTDTVFNTTAKFSRFNFKTTTNTDAGKVTTYVELDFNGGDGSATTNQGFSGLRHAFLGWDYSDSGNFLAGQTWSTFFNTGALPETADFVGPTSGTVFVRQSQVRWTTKVGSGNSVMLAAEKPASSVGGLGGNANNGGNIPDLIARYNGTVDGFSYSAALMARQISVHDGNFSNSESETGAGLSVAGAWKFGNGDNLKFMFNYGELGRYVVLGAFDDGRLNGTSIDLRKTLGGFVAYQHKWTDKLRSTALYAYTEAENEANVTRAGDTEWVANASLNLMYSPAKALTLGGEITQAEKELENGSEGTETRVQFTAKYAF